MTDLELTEAVAKKCGYSIKCISERFVYIYNSDKIIITFDPLHDMNDLFKYVIPKLDEGIRIEFDNLYFEIHYGDEGIAYNGPLSDLNRAVCETMIKE